MALRVGGNVPEGIPLPGSPGHRGVRPYPRPRLRGRQHAAALDLFHRRRQRLLRQRAPLPEGRDAPPPKDAVRIEELVNYFPYDYPAPSGDLPFSVTTEVASCPWKPEHHLVRIGLRGQPVAEQDVPPRNLVFLLDVSGSMDHPRKLPLLNVGITSQGALVRLIEEKRKTGVFLSVLGFGEGNLKDSTMEKLADSGNGNYSYIDSLAEARKVLVSEAGGTLVTSPRT